jgi:hypothetical protein
MKLNQIRRRIELCMREMILRFRWIYRIYFFLDSLIHIRIFKQVPKYLATGLQRPSGTYNPPAEASTQGLKWKINTIPILMHQMRISTNQVSSVVLRPKTMNNSQYPFSSSASILDVMTIKLFFILAMFTVSHVIVNVWRNISFFAKVLKTASNILEMQCWKSNKLQHF